MSPAERETRSTDANPNANSPSLLDGADGTTPTQGSRPSPSNANGTGTSVAPNQLENSGSGSAPSPSDNISTRQNLSNGDSVSSRPSSRDRLSERGIEDWFRNGPVVVAEDAIDGAERNSTVLAGVAGMGASGDLGCSGYPQHLDIDEDMEEMPARGDDST